MIDKRCVSKLMGYLGTLSGTFRSPCRLRIRSGSPEVVREEKALLSKIAREQARFSLEVRKDDQRWEFSMQIF